MHAIPFNALTNPQKNQRTVTHAAPGARMSRQLLATLSGTLLVPFRRASGETRRSDFDRLMRGGMKQLLRGHTSQGQPLLLMMAKEVVQRLLIRC
jgi:hypothetical protein